MKTQQSIIKSFIAICVFAALFSCDNQAIDPAKILDEDIIPQGFVQSEELTLDTQTRLDELRLENPDNQYYYLKLENGPVSSVKDLMFPQKELMIEFAEQQTEANQKRQYNGIIVKRIQGDWNKEEFKFFDQQASVEGGMKEYYRLLGENIKYPDEAKKAGVEGKVFVQFIIEANGALSDVKAVKGIGHGCDEEAVRVIKEIGSWNPAKIMGQNVKVRMILPITYKLE